MCKRFMRYDFSAGGMYALAHFVEATGNELSCKIVMDILSCIGIDFPDTPYEGYANAAIRLNISIHSTYYDNWSPYAYSVDGLMGDAIKFGFADDGTYDSYFIVELPQNPLIYPYHLLIDTSEMYLRTNEWQFYEAPSPFDPSKSDFSLEWFTQPSGTGKFGY